MTARMRSSRVAPPAGGSGRRRWRDEPSSAIAAEARRVSLASARARSRMIGNPARPARCPARRPRRAQVCARRLAGVCCRPRRSGTTSTLASAKPPARRCLLMAAASGLMALSSASGPSSNAAGDHVAASASSFGQGRRLGCRGSM